MPKSGRQSLAQPPRGAFIVVNGRRWRASDPAIPPALRQELVDELMAARRAVKDSLSERQIRRSRRRVDDAKVALGERGHPWWLEPTNAAVTRRIDATLSVLQRRRGPGKYIRPGEVARIAGGTAWRRILPLVRERGLRLRARGAIEILSGAKVVKADQTGGVMRYRIL